MIYANLFLTVVKKEDIESILTKEYIKLTTIKEVIVPKEGNEEHYCVVYSNFTNPLLDLKDKSLFSLSMELDYSVNVEDTVCVDFKFKELIKENSISEIEQFYILNGDKRTLVDISNYNGVGRIERFIVELNKHSCEECIHKTNKLISRIANIADNSLKNPKEMIIE